MVLRTDENTTSNKMSSFSVSEKTALMSLPTEEHTQAMLVRKSSLQNMKISMCIFCTLQKKLYTFRDFDIVMSHRKSFT